MASDPVMIKVVKHMQ